MNLSFTAFLDGFGSPSIVLQKRENGLTEASCSAPYARSMVPVWWQPQPFSVPLTSYLLRIFRSGEYLSYVIWVLEKRFHARWWDYSTIPLNINGRICVPVSIAFGLAGVAVVKFLIPAVEGIHSVVNPLVYEVLAIIFGMLFGADYALTEASLSALLKDVEKMHEEFNVKAQKRYEQVTSAPKIIEQKIQEEKEQVEMMHSQLVKAYADRLSLNQKRILLGIKKFIPKKPENLEGVRIPLGHITTALSDRVRELRGKKK